jgi:gamma-glutamyl-gamma-aminobutyrate hydrolase PuuD
MVVSNIPKIGITATEDYLISRLKSLAENYGGTPDIFPIKDDILDISHAGSIEGLICISPPSNEVLKLLSAVTDRDIPTLAIGPGVESLNMTFGGMPAVIVEGHGSKEHGDAVETAKHRIYIAPGSKLASALGSGGFVMVNSHHKLGLHEAQKSSSLLASAYSLSDGVIEAVESPSHSWVVGVQFRPEIKLEVPPQFERLFGCLVDRASSR